MVAMMIIIMWMKCEFLARTRGSNKTIGGAASARSHGVLRIQPKVSAEKGIDAKLILQFIAFQGGTSSGRWLLQRSGAFLIIIVIYCIAGKTQRRLHPNSQNPQFLLLVLLLLLLRPSQKTSSGNISRTKCGIKSPLVTKQPETFLDFFLIKEEKT